MNIEEAFNAVSSITIGSGPNLMHMFIPWIVVEQVDESKRNNVDIQLKFEDVTFRDEHDTEIDAAILGSAIIVPLISISFLYSDILNSKRGDFTITINYLSKTFTGNYNTNTKEGTLWLVKS